MVDKSLHLAERRFVIDFMHKLLEDNGGDGDHRTDRTGRTDDTLETIREKLSIVVVSD